MPAHLPRLPRWIAAPVLGCSALCLTVNLNAHQVREATSAPAPHFNSQEFRTALAKVLHARFDGFSELKTGTAVFQLPEMSCSTVSDSDISYSCDASALSPSEAETQYSNLMSVFSALLAGYLPCKENNASAPKVVKLAAFCHSANSEDAHISLNGEGSVHLLVNGRKPDDIGEPVQILRARALADLGRYKDAKKAFKSIDPAGTSNSISRETDLEEFLYETSARNVAKSLDDSTPMNPEDLLAVGSLDKGEIIESQIIDSIHQFYKKHPGTMDEEKAEFLALDYDVRARIKAATGKPGAALRDLDSAIKALPDNAKTAPEKAAYYYHRALILAMDGKYTDASKACRESLDIENENGRAGKDRNRQCLVIDALAFPPNWGGKSGPSSTAQSSHAAGSDLR